MYFYEEFRINIIIIEDCNRGDEEAEEAAFVGEMGEVYQITKKLVNTNTKADTPFLDLNGNILYTDEENTLNHVVSSEVPPLAPITETVSPGRSIPQTPPSKAARIGGISAEFFKSNPYMAAEVLQPMLEEAWSSETFPKEWTDGIIVKIPQKR